MNQNEKSHFFAGASVGFAVGISITLIIAAVATWRFAP